MQHSLPVWSIMGEYTEAPLKDWISVIPAHWWQHAVLTVQCMWSPSYNLRSICCTVHMNYIKIIFDGILVSCVTCSQYFSLVVGCFSDCMLIKCVYTHDNIKWQQASTFKSRLNIFVKVSTPDPLLMLSDNIKWSMAYKYVTLQCKQTD